MSNEKSRDYKDGYVAGVEDCMLTMTELFKVAIHKKALLDKTVVYLDEVIEIAERLHDVVREKTYSSTGDSTDAGE